MQRLSVDGNFRRVSLLHARTRVESRDEDGLALLDADLLLSLGRSDVAGKLARLVGLGGTSLDCDVGHDLRPERLPEDDLAAEAVALLGRRSDGRVFEILRSDAEHYVTARVRAEARPVQIGRAPCRERV